jgi:pilus assembly protein CpaC
MKSPALKVLTVLLPLLAGAALADDQAPGGSTLIRAFAGKSIVIDSPEPLKRVSVTDPAVASATVIGPRQVLLHGHQPGSVTLILWDEAERTRSFDLSVERDLEPLRQSLRQALPGETIEVSQSRGSIVLSGQVSSKTVSDQAVALAQAHAEKVVSLLADNTVQVSLKVRVAEVNRSAFKDLGVGLFATGLAGSNLIGTVGTGQFSQTLANVGAVPADVQKGRDPQAPSLVTGGIGNTAQGTPAVFGLSDLLNIFFFLPDRNVGAVIRALEQRKMLEILAEPNLLARNGREASFLAGGEFPFPTVQGVSGGFPAVTIVFKEFGIRLKFTPTVSSDNRIGLKLVQEVSALDFANAITISGFVVPALSTRRTETELQLGDGQSFAISGLLDKRLTEVSSKIPGLGDIPVLGKLFRSRSKQRSDSELLVIVTPALVQPIAAGAKLPGPPLQLETLPPIEPKKEGKKERDPADTRAEQPAAAKAEPPAEANGQGSAKPTGEDQERSEGSGER